MELHQGTGILNLAKIAKTCPNLGYKRIDDRAGFSNNQSASNAVSSRIRRQTLQGFQRCLFELEDLKIKAPEIYHYEGFGKHFGRPDFWVLHSSNMF